MFTQTIKVIELW